MENRAKVFVSCGQREDYGEKEIAERVGKVLQDLGFDVYLGIKDNTLDSVRENLFPQLEDSEYFLFIDFKREELKTNEAEDRDGKKKFRGSLFSHQELALATYLEFKERAIGFHEQGVRREGLAWGQQLNSQEFCDRDALPDLVKEVVEKKIKQKEWNASWKAQLSLDRSPEEFGGDKSDPPYVFHIEVTNQHWMRTAHGCRALLWKAEEIKTKRVLTTHNFELKWAGIQLPEATIVQGGTRSFDAFEIRPEAPTVLEWSMAFTDTIKVWPQITEPGMYRLEFIVTSQNFWNVWAAFQLNLLPNIDDTKLTLVEQRTGPMV